MPEREVATFYSRPERAAAPMNMPTVVTAVIGPATSAAARGREFASDITVDDITMFVRMTVTACGEESRAKAIDMLPGGVICPIEHNTVDSGQT